MTLAIDSIGPFRIEREIGRGGMGVVFLARDTRLDRPVAIKALPEHLSEDPDRLARFQREAKVLASLNHPGIGAIYGMEEADGRRYLVLEYVEGETLAARLERGAIPVDEALEIAKQIAEALEAAHEKGIIHRDLKPGNVMLTDEGRAKVLDFGLARATDGTPSSTGVALNPESPTLTSPARIHSPTIPGVIMGSAGYMSPEQARGRAVDKRSDIFSFGCVLYELLSGAQPFPGETTTDSIGAILHREPDWHVLPGSTPPTIGLLLRRCLTKDRNRRLHDIADARIEIEQAIADPSSSSLIAPGDLARIAGASHRHGTWQRALPWAVACALGLGGIAVALSSLWSAPFVARPVIRFTEVLPAGLSVAISDAPAIALSPDGESLAYVANDRGLQRIYLRRFDSPDASPLLGTEGAQHPFFSPDGQWLGFIVERVIKKIAVSGGPTFSMNVIADQPRGAVWASDQSLVFTPGTNRGLVRAQAGASEPVNLTTLDSASAERTHRWPQMLLNGAVSIYSVGRLDSPESYDDARIEAVSLASGDRTVLFEGACAAWHDPAGFLLCARAGTLMAMPFDANRLRVTGSAFPVLSDVLSTRGSGAVHLAISRSGTLAYVPGVEARSASCLVVADRGGTFKETGVVPGAYSEVSLSPDGTRAALVVSGDRTLDIWVVNLADSGMTRLTFEGQNLAPCWSPDGKRIAFASARDGKPLAMYWKPADGSREEQLLLGREIQLNPESWSPDGTILSFMSVTGTGDTDLWMMPVDSPKEVAPLMEGKGETWNSAISPNGRWMAYQSDEGGRYEVYVRPFPGPGGKWQVSTDGGSEPKWSANGKELFFRRGETLLVAPIEAESTLRAGTPRIVLNGLTSGLAGEHGSYAVSPDGERIYMARPSEQSRPTRINVIVNWSEELGRKAGSSGPPNAHLRRTTAD